MAKMIRGNLRVPWYMARILKPFVVGNYWPEHEMDQASDLIEEGSYEAAEVIITDVERRYGSSTETVMLTARISTIQILASEYGWRDELVNRYRAIRGAHLLHHWKIVDGRAIYYHGITRMTFVKLAFIWRTIWHGV